MKLNTIGSEPCQIILNEILVNHNDSKINNLVMSRWNAVKSGISKLNKLTDKSFYFYILNLFRTNQLQELDLLKNKLPREVFTHLRCCIVGLFRNAIREKK